MRKAHVVLLALCAIFAVAGCGTGGMQKVGAGDVQNGGKLFTAKCAGCHSLAAAGSTATVGPNLDGAFGADRQQGFKESTILNVVVDQVRDPSPPMPGPDQLFPTCRNGSTTQPAGCVPDRETAIRDVAAYVASTAGTKGSEPKSTATKSTDGKTIFTSNCASCHTLAAAQATGKIGPNLDQLKPSQAIVKHQVENGGGVMPAFKGRLTDEQIKAVATFVADNAGK